MTDRGHLRSVKSISYEPTPPAQPPDDAAEPHARSRPLDRTDTVVLVVDPEPALLKVLASALTRAGYTVIAAQSGESALAILRSQTVDVLLVELRISDLRGDVIFEVAAGYQPGLRYTTLFMTGDVTENAHKLIAACNCHFLQKPFELGDMMDAVAGLATAG